MDWELLAPLQPEERRRLLSVARRRRYRKGEPLFHEGDPGDTLHLIDKGHVAMRVTTPVGDVATLLIAGPGDYFGELALVTPGAVRNSSVVALDAVETLTVHRDQFDELRRENVAIETMLMQALAAEVRRLSGRLLEAMYVSVEKRIFRRLIDLAGLFPASESDVVAIPITQDDLSTLAGTTRPTANKIVKAAEASGLLRVARGRIELLDLDRLAQRAR